MTIINNKIYAEFTVKGIPCPLCFVQGGTMDIGEGEDKHSVTIPSFHIGQFQVTQELYKVIMKEIPSHFKGATRPVERVSWDDTHKFLNELNILTGKEFRLPTESEWEFAAKGGIESQGYKFCGSDDIKQVGWYRDNSGRETKPVGLLLPNELGIYDMSGNVWEWCEDDYHSNFKVAPPNGKPWIDRPDRAVYRVLRGGNYFDDAGNCRPTSRDYYSPGARDGGIGFRVVLAPVQ